MPNQTICSIGQAQACVTKHVQPVSFIVTTCKSQCSRPDSASTAAARCPPCSPLLSSICFARGMVNAGGTTPIQIETQMSAPCDIYRSKDKISIFCKKNYISHINEYCRKTMRDNECDELGLGHDVVQGLLDQLFVLVVERRCRFVKKHDLNKSNGISYYEHSKVSTSRHSEKYNRKPSTKIM